MARNNMPDTVFIGPPRYRAVHKLVVFQILERDENGIPVNLKLLKETEQVDVKEGMQFMLGYVKEFMLKPNPDHANYKQD
jgi:hypothetical protein